MNKHNQVINSKVILQYYVHNKVCGNIENIEFSVLSHGNSKDKKPFYAIQKSTISSCKSQLSGSSSKRSISVLYDKIHQDIGDDGDFGDRPRSKKQLLDLCRKQFADNEVGDILAYNEELRGGSIIWYHGDISSDLWVIGTENMPAEILNSSKRLPLSTDPTFNFVIYEVTPLTYRNALVESKSKNVRDEWVPATMIGPAIIQHDKSTQTYETALMCIAKKIDLHKNVGVCIITDGETALVKACKASFQNSTMLHCTRHFEANCKEMLKKIGIPSTTEELMMDIVFGENGLIEAEDKKDLKQKLRESAVLLSEVERGDLKLPEDYYKGKRATYILDREKTVLRKVMRKARRYALKMSDLTVPTRLYTNQSKTINSILSAKKAALGYKKKEDLSKFTFIKKIFQASVDHQRREIEKALIGQSSEYRLNKNAEDLQVPLEMWTNFSKVNKREYLDFVTHLSKEEIKNMKTITATFWETDEHSVEPTKTSLSVKLSEHLNILHADIIEQKSLDLLNNPSAIPVTFSKKQRESLPCCRKNQ